MNNIVEIPFAFATTKALQTKASTFTKKKLEEECPYIIKLQFTYIYIGK
jgi:hypothetical protein